MWLLALCVWILFDNHAFASDITGAQNDIIPDQAMQLPDGTFCFFTMSELMFTDKMQQVASSAYRVGAARLVDMHVISSTSYNYDNLWGAYYFVQREDYSSLIQYARTRDTVSFVSTMEVETIENESGLCVLTDIGLQPNTYPSTQDCSQCYGSGGSSNQPSMDDYQQELSAMGVPDSYIQTMGNLPTMQNTGSPSAQMPGSMQTPSVGASGQVPGLGASAQANLTPTPSLGGSAQTPLLGASANGNLSSAPSVGGSAQTPFLGASAGGNLSSNPSIGGSAQTPFLGASAGGNLSSNPSIGGSAQTPFLGASAGGNLQPSTGSNNDPGQSTRYNHQLRSPYPQSVVSPPSTFSSNRNPPYAPFQNQFVPQSSQLQPISSPTGPMGAGFSGGVYQPQTNFSGGYGGSGNQQPSSVVPGFTFASQQYSFLSAQGGGSFMTSTL